mgnify:CR=1 FL=1
MPQPVWNRKTTFPSIPFNSRFKLTGITAAGTGSDSRGDPLGHGGGVFDQSTFYKHFSGCRIESAGCDTGGLAIFGEGCIILWLWAIFCRTRCDSIVIKSPGIRRKSLTKQCNSILHKKILPAKSVNAGQYRIGCVESVISCRAARSSKDIFPPPAP